MYCKYCGKPMEDSAKVCPSCGKSIAEAKVLNWKRIAVVAAVAVVMAAVIAVAIIAINGGFAPRENNIHYKDSYTVSENKLSSTMDKVVATAGPYSLTNRELQVYYWMQVMDFVNYYGSYLQYYGLDYTKPLDEQYADEEAGLTWEQYFLDEAIYRWNQYAVMAHNAKLQGFQLPASYEETFENLYDDLTESMKDGKFETVDDMLRSELGPAANFEVYEKYLHSYYEANEFLSELYDKTDLTDDEVETFFEENAKDLQSNYGVTKTSGKLATVRHILITPKGGTKDENGKVVYSEAEWNTCRNKAQELLNEWLAGNQSEMDFAYMASDHTEDPGSKENGGMYSRFPMGKMVKPFENWCFDESRQKGDTGIVETEYGCHIMYFVEADEGWKLYSADGARGEKISEQVKAWSEELTLEVNYKELALAEHSIVEDKK